MNDEPTRLRLDPDLDAELRATLDAGREQPGDDERIERLALRLGPLLLPPSGGGGGGGGAGGPAVKAASVAKGATTLATVAKGIALAAAIGAAGTMVVIERAHMASTDPVQAPTQTQPIDAHEVTDPAPPTPTGRLPALNESPELPEVDADGTDDDGTRAPRPRRDRVTAPELEVPVPPETQAETPLEVPVPSVETAPSESSLLRAAMASLARDPASALAQAELHGRHHPRGAMADEREVIAIDALVRLGRRPEAEARAAHFRDAHPSSPSLRRIERILAN